MRLVKAMKGTHAGSDLISLYVDDSTGYEYYTSSKLLADCKSWDNESVARIVCDTPTKRVYRSIFNVDKRLTAVWLKSLQLHKPEISDVSSIPMCLNTMVTEDETQVVQEDFEDIPTIEDDDMFSDDSMFGELEEIPTPITMGVVSTPEPEPEIIHEDTMEEDDLFGSIGDVEETLTEIEVEDVPTIGEVVDIVELEPEDTYESEIEELDIPVAPPVMMDVPVTDVTVEVPVARAIPVTQVAEDNLAVDFKGGLPSHINQAIASLVQAGVAFTVTNTGSEYIINVSY